ncbi:MAG TPA: TniQ family protein [Pyrinomonadaceae bacterium]|jgi:hypothetical protein
MKKAGKKLLRTERPLPDESPVGFVLRLTELNGYETPWWVLCLSGLEPSALHNCQFVFGSQWNVELLSVVTGVNPSELSALKYAAAPTKNSTYRYEVFGSPIARYFICPKHPKICPACLRTSGYCRKIWELAPVTVCPLHRCMLIDECPKCKKRISWVRREVSVCRCGYDWRDAPLNAVSGSELSVVLRVYRLCNLPSGKAVPVRKSDVNPLDDLDLEYGLSALFFLAAQDRGVTDTTGKLSVKGKRNTELHNLLVKFAAVFDRWPKKFEEFLSRRRGRFPSKRASGSGLYKDFGTFYYGLYYNLSSDKFDFMRRAFEDYVGRYWSGGYAAVLMRRKGSGLNDRKYISRNEARIRLRVNHPYINWLIEQGMLKALVRERSKKRMFLIEAASVAKLEPEFRDLLTGEQAAQLLNVTPRTILELVRYKCLKPRRGPNIDGLAHWKFTRSEVNELLSSLDNRIVQDINPREADLMNLSAIMRTNINRLYNLGSFLRAVLDGRISPCGKDESGGLKRFLFAKEKVNNLLTASGIT